MAQTTTGLAGKTVGDQFSSTDFNAINNVINSNALDAGGRLEDNLVIVKSIADLASIDSSKVYLIDGSVAMSGTSIQVPVGGLTLVGRGPDVSQLTSSTASHTVFTSPGGGSGNLRLIDLCITTSGIGSSVFALTDATGFSAVEMRGVNFIDCTSRGYFDGYRQGLEIETGLFGGTPELEFRNAWVGGYRISSSIARAMANFTALFKAGAGFTVGGRWISDMNVDLPATGALFDFAPSNITQDEALILSNSYTTRVGVIDPSDTTIYPNIDHTSLKSLWSQNIGLPNTSKHLKANITGTLVTTIVAANTYYPLEGTFTVGTGIHLDMPANGEFRNIAGAANYLVTGDVPLSGTAGSRVDLRVTKSTDDGATWPTVVDHTSREVLNLTGGLDEAFMPISFVVDLQPGDRIRMEVENKSTATDLTATLDSYINIVKVG